MPTKKIAHTTVHHASTTTTKEPTMTTTTTTHPADTAATPATLSTATTTAGGIAPLPTTGAPPVPSGYAPSGAIAKRIRAPKEFSSLAAGIVTELRTSTTYAADFGKNAPSQSDLADRVELAAGWLKEDLAAQAWAVHAHDQATQSWQVTQPRLYELAPAFKYAMQRDPTVAERYASAVSFFGLATAAAQRGAATRKAHKEGKTTQKDKVKAAKAAVRKAVSSDASAAPPPTATTAPVAPSLPATPNGAGH